MRDATFFESHPVRLSTNDLIERGAELSALLVKISSDEAHAKAAAAAAKSAIDTLKNEAGALARTVHSKQENRPVECKDNYCRSNMTVETARLDTGEIVSSRPMTAEERKDAFQAELDFARRAAADDARDDVLDAVAEQVNEGALGPDVTATVERTGKRGSKTTTVRTPES